MIKLKNVGKKFEDQLIFSDVSINARPGDFIGITGRTGCGKSTLLNIISGYESYDVGSNKICDIEQKDCSSKEVNFIRNKRIAFLFQSFNLIEELSIYENLKLSFNLSVNKSKQIDGLLSKVGMLEYKHKKVKNLSGGQKQRIALLRAVAKDFDILICDEPTGNLDDTNSKIILELIRDLCIDKVVIMVTHKKSVSNEYFNKVYEFSKDKSSFELVKDNRNQSPVVKRKVEFITISKLGTMVHSLKRLLMLKGFNVALILFMSLFMIAYANAAVLAGGKYEDLVLKHEAKNNPMYELTGYASKDGFYENSFNDELIAFVGNHYEFYGAIKLFNKEYRLNSSTEISALKLIETTNNEVTTRVIPGGLDSGKFVKAIHDSITVTTFDPKTFPHSEILVGRLPENEYEVIIDVSSLIKLLSDFDLTYSEYINGNLKTSELERLMNNKYFHYYYVSPYKYNEENGITEQFVNALKLKIVGFIDSKNLSNDISGIYVTSDTFKLLDDFVTEANAANLQKDRWYSNGVAYYYTQGDAIIYKADASEQTHDLVVDLVEDEFRLDRERVKNIESSYMNVRTMVDFNYVLAILSLVIFIVGFITLMIYTFSHYKHDIALYRSLGYNSFYIMVILAFNNILLALLGFGLAVCLNTYVVSDLFGYNQSLTHMANSRLDTGLFISLGIIMVINIIYVMRYRNKPVNSIL